MLQNWAETNRVIDSLKKFGETLESVCVVRSCNIRSIGVKSVLIHPKYSDFEIVFSRIVLKEEK